MAKRGRKPLGDRKRMPVPLKLNADERADLDRVSAAIGLPRAVTVRRLVSLAAASMGAGEWLEGERDRTDEP